MPRPDQIAWVRPCPLIDERSRAAVSARGEGFQRICRCFGEGMIVVRSDLFHIVLAICLVGGTWYACHPTLPTGTEAAPSRALAAVPTAEADVMDRRTGDFFWGLHLDAVVPCSSMVVKGGGNLVTLSVQSDPAAHCVYHVVHEKRIELHGKAFRLRVIAADQIHVEREPASNSVAQNQ
jgi:hypothetical protein